MTIDQPSVRESADSLSDDDAESHEDYDPEDYDAEVERLLTEFYAD